MFVCLFICLFVYLFICLFICLFVYLFICLFVCLFRKHEFSSPSGPSPLPTVFETKRGAAEIGVLRKRNLELIPSVPSSRNKDNNNVDNNLWAKPVREVSIKESNSFRSPTKSEFVTWWHKVADYSRRTTSLSHFLVWHIPTLMCRSSRPISSP